MAARILAPFLRHPIDPPGWYNRFICSAPGRKYIVSHLAGSLTRSLSFLVQLGIERNVRPSVGSNETFMLAGSSLRRRYRARADLWENRSSRCDRIRTLELRPPRGGRRAALLKSFLRATVIGEIRSANGITRRTPSLAYL